MDTLKKKPDIDTFREVCDAKGGILSYIATALGRPRSTIYNWCESDPAFKQAIDEARERTLDLAESQLQTLIRGVPQFETNEQGQKVLTGWQVKPSETAIIFFLKTKGKKRGYVERQELDANVKMKGSINIREWVKDRLKA